MSTINVTSRQRGLIAEISVDTFRHLSNADLRFLAGCRASNPKWGTELARREAAGIDHVPTLDDIADVDAACERFAEGRHA